MRLTDADLERLERLVYMAAKQPENIDGLILAPREAIPDLIADLREARAENVKMRERARRAEILLIEWLETPFFENHNDWLKWRNDYVSRVIDCVDANGEARLHRSAKEKR